MERLDLKCLFLVGLSPEFLVKTVFCCHRESWKCNIQLCSCLQIVETQSETLGSLIACNSPTVPSAPRYHSQAVNYCCQKYQFLPPQWFSTCRAFRTLTPLCQRDDTLFYLMSLTSLLLQSDFCPPPNTRSRNCGGESALESIYGMNFRRGSRIRRVLLVLLSLSHISSKQGKPQPHTTAQYLGHL